MTFNVDQLRIQIEALIRDYPDIADDEVLRGDMLDAETDIKAVLTSLFNTADDTKMMIQAITLRLQELSERRARFARRVDFLRELMLKILQSADLKKIELPEATLSQRAGTPQIIGGIDADGLPDDLVRIKREPDLVKIRDALLARREVLGLFLSNSPPTLMVKVK